MVKSPVAVNVVPAASVKVRLFVKPLKIKLVHELLLFIVQATVMADAEVPNCKLGKVVDDVPPIVCVAPFKITVSFTPVSVPPLLVQLPSTSKLLYAVKFEPAARVNAPAIITLPAPAFKVSFVEALFLTIPNVIFALGVIAPLPVKVVVLAALKTMALVLLIKPFLMLIAQPAVVVNTGLLALPKVNEGELPLKFIIPVLVTDKVP